MEPAIEKMTDKFQLQSLAARETVLPAIEKSWQKRTDFAELRVTRHSGTSSAKRCLVAGEADVDVTAALGRANCAVGLPIAHTNVFSTAGYVRQCSRSVHGARMYA